MIPANEIGSSLPREDHLSLELLGAIAENQSATQRDLSSRLGVALGLTNALLKRLVLKGYIKVARVSPRRVRYLLTPQGIVEKSRLTYSYIQHSIGYYRDVRSRVQNLFDRLALDGVKRIVFVGTGEVAEIGLICLHGTPLELVAVVDDARIGGVFLGHAVRAIGALSETEHDAVVVTAVQRDEALFSRLEEAGVLRERIFELDGSGPGAGLRKGGGGGRVQDG